MAATEANAAAERPDAPAWTPPRALSPAGKAALVVEILRTYVRVRVLVRRRLDDAVAELRQPVATPRPLPQSSVYRSAIRLGEATRRTLRLLPTDGRCLMQALVLTRLLAVRGIDTTLVIGVKSAPEFAAHAWVEISGEPVLNSGGDYAPLYSV